MSDAKLEGITSTHLVRAFVYPATPSEILVTTFEGLQKRYGQFIVTVQALWNVGTDFVLVPFAVISYALGDEAGAHEAIAA